MKSRLSALAVVLLLSLPGCLASPQPPAAGSAQQVAIVRDTLWQGRIVIDGSVKVFKGATLTIAPGSEILFTRRDDDRDGLGDGTLIVEGSLSAIGTRSRPIVFRSAAADPRPGDWLEIRVDFSRSTTLRYCEIRDSAHTLHAHFTKAEVEDSHIHHNIDGCRLGQGNFAFRRNLIEENEGKGINFRNATVEIRDNIIRRNAAGIFLFETDRPPLIEHNNFHDNGDHLRLGDFFHTDLTIGENWWGSADPATVAATIYDRAEDSTLGRVTVGIAPAWLAGTGPRDRVGIKPIMRVATGAFVDAAPLPLGPELIVASWDTKVRRIAPDGTLRWEVATGEVIDGGLASDGRRIFAQSWGREVLALSATNGDRLWSFTYPPSPADDHRQGEVVLAGETLLVPAWNGTLYALAAATGAEFWHFSTPGPLRAAPTVDGERLYLPSGDGVLRTLDLAGNLLWSWRGESPQLAGVVVDSDGPLVLDRDGTLSALDRAGRLRWQKVLGEHCYYAAPRLDGDSLFVATAAGSLWHLDRSSGRTIWQRSGLGPVYATPLLADGRVLVGDNDGQLTVWSAAGGDLLATLKAGGAIQGGPVAVGRRIAFGSRDHHLYLIETVDSAEAP